MLTASSHGFAADPDLPSRDTLLDADAVAQRLPRVLAREGRLDIDRCTLVRAKYRIGESLRVVYRLDIGDSSHLVAARAFLGEDSVGALHRAVPLAVASGPLQPVAHDPELGAVWWTFPNDRKLRGIEALLRPSLDVAAPLAGLAPWTASQVVEYAPERSVTLRAVGANGAASAYVKAYAPGSVDLPWLARRYALVARALGRSPAAVCSPEPLWWSDTHHALLLQALPGRSWDQLAPGTVTSALRRLGAGIATLHDVRLFSATESGGLPLARAFPRFRRLDIPRVLHSAELVGRARPDVAGSARRLADALSCGPPVQQQQVLLHGDCHPKNALLQDAEVALIDLDQTGIGPAAADLGSLLARLERSRIVQGADTAELAAAFLDGYAEVRPTPDPESLAWHTSAALLAEQAMRAVNRVRPEALDHLGELLASGHTALRPKVRV